MTLFSSLRSRIFLTSALLAVLSIAMALYLVNVRVTREAESALQREILSTGALVDQLRTERTQTFTLMARLIADLPKLKAAVETNDPPTVHEIADGYKKQLNANLVLVTNRAGEVLYAAGASPDAGLTAAAQPAVHEALGRREATSLLPQSDGMLQIVTVPIAIDRPQPELFGTLSVGFLLNDALAAQLKRITGSDIAFGMGDRILAATLPRDDYPTLAKELSSTGVSHVRLGNDEYVALPRPLTGSATPASERPVALILRSRTEQLKSLQAIHAGLGVTALLAALLAFGLSFAVARTITRPLATITDVMREMATTGDLTRKIALRHQRRWDDEDARLLATTFNTLTDSVARFQRDMSQKERLSSLGRLSTVIAHEVRNPLMIIKAALHTLRRATVDPAAMREAVADIDGEVVRLNRIVNEVLDFARPIHFEVVPVDLNALCAESAAAARTAGPDSEVHLDLDRSLPAVTTDPERLRQALVNMLVNAWHAVEAWERAARPVSVGVGVADPGAARVSLRTRADGNRATIVIADRGIGIESVDLPRVFDPYFTTKRGGTGLGLAIAKNIIDGLGGTIGVASAPGVGTEIHIDLPI
jgi:signal transduction histidine kinase